MKVAPKEKIDALVKAIGRIGYFREHNSGCEIGQTDFCTCGMKQAVDAARAALALEVES